jgi:hypothetical protein
MVPLTKFVLINNAGILDFVSPLEDVRPNFEFNFFGALI